MRRLGPLLVAATLLSACAASGGVAAPTVDPVAYRIQRLHDATAHVAAVQDTADRSLAAALGALRSLVEVLDALGDPEQVDGVRDRWPSVDTAVAAVDPEAIRGQLVDLAIAVDEARVVLQRAREVLPSPWERAYLDAEDAVLVAVRRYAEVTDELARNLITHWPTVTEAHALAARFVEQRWFYRSAREAADAFRVQFDRLQPRLAAAVEAIDAAVAAREGAAAEVNAAVSAAAAIWRQRPTRPQAHP